MSIIIHHLNNSRSQRILWLLEELKVSYEIRHYARDAVTNLAPEAACQLRYCRFKNTACLTTCLRRATCARCRITTLR